MSNRWFRHGIAVFSLTTSMASTAVFGQTPANDNFANAIPLTGPSGYVAGSTLNATRESGEPFHWTNSVATPSVWYTITPDNAGVITLSTCGLADWDTVLAVYTGSSVGSLSRVAQADDSCSYQTTLSFTPSPGVTYRIAVAGYAGSSFGPFQMTWQQAVPTPKVAFSVASTTYGNGAAGAFSYGNRLIGSAPVAITATIRNSGQLPLSLANLSVPPNFTVTEGLSASLAPGAQDTFTVQMGTATAGTYSGVVRFETNDPTTPVFSVGANGVVYAVPTNDNFSAASLLSGNEGIVTGATLGATREASEPAHWGSSNSSPSVWYSFTPSDNVRVTLNTCSAASFDSVLAAYTGSSVNALTLIANNDDSCGLRSSISFLALSGTTYRIAVAGYSSTSQGSFELSWTSTPLPNAPDIEVYEGTRLIPNNTVSGLDFGSVSIGTATTTRTIRVRNLGVQPLLASLTVPAGYIVTEPLSASIAPNSEDSFSIRLDASSAGIFAGKCSIVSNDPDESPYSIGITGAVYAQPANDDFAAAYALPGNSGIATGLNIGATRESGEPNHAGLSSTRSVWWTYTAGYTGSLYIDTLGSTFDTVLAVYSGSSVSTLSAIASNDDIGGGNLASRVVLSVTAGNTYRICVDGYSSASGQIRLNYGPTTDQPTSPPVVPPCTATLISPTAGTPISAGQVFTFSISGGCSGSLYIIFTGSGSAGSASGAPFISFPVSGSSFTVTQGIIDQIRSVLGNTLGTFWCIGTVSNGAVGSIIGGPVAILLPVGYGAAGSTVQLPATACINFAGQAFGNTSLVGCGDVVRNHLPVRLLLSGGDVQIVASGYCKTSSSTPSGVGPEGELGSLIASDTAYAAYGVPVVSARFSSLIGKWDNQSTPFFIGAGGRFTPPPGATRLYLGVHDSTCWSDNTGGYTVVVTGGTVVAPAGISNWSQY